MKLLIAGILSIFILAVGAAVYFDYSKPVIPADPEAVAVNTTNSTSVSPLPVPLPVPTPIPSPIPNPPPTSEQGIYGVTYYVSGEARVEGPNRYGYALQIPVLKRSNLPPAGSVGVNQRPPEKYIVADIRSDMQGNYRLVLMPGDYCAWDMNLHRCYDQELRVRSGTWTRADFTVFGQ